MVFERTYDRYVNMVPSPTKIEEISWESSKWKLCVSFNIYSISFNIYSVSFSIYSARQWFGGEASWLQ